MRNRFDKQLSTLNVELIKMGSLCQEILELSNAPILDLGDFDLIKIEEIERDINIKQREIETLCMRMLLRQQPVAKDLRFISSALKMILDMERIGDQCYNVAELITELNDVDFSTNVILIKMAKACQKMLSTAIEAFSKMDLELASTVILQDDKVDDLFAEARDKMVDSILINKEQASDYIILIMIAKYFEKIGDYAVNISKWVKHINDNSLAASD